MNTHPLYYGKLGSSRGSSRRFAPPITAAPRMAAQRTSFRPPAFGGTGPGPSGPSTNSSQIIVSRKSNSRMCSVCHVTFTSGSHERDHLKGKKHAKMLQKVNGMFGRCLVCNIKYKSAKDGISHLFSQIHIRTQMEVDRANAQGLKDEAAAPVTASSEERAADITTPTRDTSQIVRKRARPSVGAKDSYNTSTSDALEHQRSTLQQTSPLRKKTKRESSAVMQDAYCTRCGSEIEPLNNFCGGCGRRLK